ncbi:ATP/GTP-binding protein [Streptodolium elevatio]|uniref:ATP/GTP-binding protein n=1 Tax=Streptodolium elevatio TaxID=3157996 RepID=A0ABV3DSB4_9ACTN
MTVAGAGGRDLRALFSTNDGGITAESAFVNRQLQWTVVADLLTERIRVLAAPGFDVGDFEGPRDNVVVFHGVGGIGKTTLSRAIEATLAGERRPEQWGAPIWPAGRRVLPVRIDLARSAGADFERVVLAIRLALAELGTPFPAFDLALRRYWEHNHPGEPLEEYLRRGGLGRFGEALPRQMESAAAEVAQALLPLPGVGAAVGAAGSLVRALRERRQAVRALADCTRLADLLDAEPDLDALSFYPHLLAWELERLPQEKRVLPVVLLDTFEDVGDRTRRDFERLLQRVVWLMPNAAFVVSGRSRLDWADPGLAGQLDYAGPGCWPGLADPGASPVRGPAYTGTGRQVLVGDFSSEDCDGYLVRRLTVDGRPLIGEQLRTVIAGRSHGLPLYLDLAVMRFLEIRRSGREPEPDHFDADFPALVARTLSDLTEPERHVLRAVSLLDAFDLDLASRAAGLIHQAAALRLVERPFVREDPFGIWPYHLHGLIRSTIRSADDHTDDRWSPTDWHAAALRAFTELGAQHAAGAPHDRRLLVGCLRQGLRLARDHRLDLDWLAIAAWRYVADLVWEPLAPPPTGASAATEQTGEDLVTPADALVELLSALARRQHEHRERTAERLTAVTTAHLLPPDLTEMAVYYLAKAQRDLGRTSESAAGMRQVADGGGPLAPDARRGLAHLARRAGDFPTALDMARTLGWEGRHHRVEGDVLWPHGDVAAAAAAYAAGRDEAERHSVAGERAIHQAHRAFALAFTDPAAADHELDLAAQLLAGLDLRATTMTTRIAALIRDAGTRGDDVTDRAEILRTEIDVAGLSATQLPDLELALAFHHAVRNDHEQVDAAIERLRQCTTGGDQAYYVDLACFMADCPTDPAGPSARARWIDGENATRQRWRGLTNNRRARHVGP